MSPARWRLRPQSPGQEQRYAAIFALPNLAACFTLDATDRAQRPAVSGPSGTLSYAELDQRARALTQQLLAQGLAPGARIAHFLPRDIDAVVALVAILRAGACYVPIDPSYPTERIEHILRDSQARLVLTHRARVQDLPTDWQPSALAIDQAMSAVPPQDEPQVARDQPAYLIYTSGSTGQPKGVLISHANALHSLAARLSATHTPCNVSCCCRRSPSTAPSPGCSGAWPRAIACTWPVKPSRKIRCSWPG